MWTELDDFVYAQNEIKQRALLGALGIFLVHPTLKQNFKIVLKDFLFLRITKSVYLI